MDRRNPHSDEDSKGAAALARVLSYHERTKHRLNRYARGPEGLDWANEPDPFLRYRGAELLPLERLSPVERLAPSYDSLFTHATPIRPRPLARDTISQLFYDSLALSAWKEHGGSRWSLRVNPSSGDLHPTEGYLVAGPVPGLHDRPAIFHYCPRVHGLEIRQELTSEQWESLGHGLPAKTVLVGLTSICWRESWKYGERAFRYTELDIGHAIAAVAVAARVMGWSARLLVGLTDSDLARLLGMHSRRGIEAERPECLLAVAPGSRSASETSLASYQPSQELLAAIAGGKWLGTHNRLSRYHSSWPVIDEVQAATSDVESRAHGSSRTSWARSAAPPLPLDRADRGLSARNIIRQRRSALELDGRTGMARADFYHMLARVVAAPSNPALAALPWRPAIHLILFVHRVAGLAPGLYLLVRDRDQLEAIHSAVTVDLDWQSPRGCPSDLDLFLLSESDYRATAAIGSCHQDIAADGAFAAAMLAQFESRLSERGPWFYRCLHWEAGAIGQVLYLEAEAAGLRATGIGCFFDDVSHNMLGLEPGDQAFQTVYHFTMGGAVEDARLISMPAYPEPWT